MKVKRSMLAYCKIILTKFSFSKPLFVKEYKKSLGWLAQHEVRPFKRWVKKNFTPAFVKALNS